MLPILESMSGVPFELLSTSERCDANAVIFNADASSQSHCLLNWAGFRAPEEVSADVIECDKTSSDALVVHNREENRLIANVIT